MAKGKLIKSYYTPFKNVFMWNVNRYKFALYVCKCFRERTTLICAHINRNCKYPFARVPDSKNDDLSTC